MFMRSNSVLTTESLCAVECAEVHRKHWSVWVGFLYTVVFMLPSCLWWMFMSRKDFSMLLLSVGEFFVSCFIYCVESVNSCMYVQVLFFPGCCFHSVGLVSQCCCGGFFFQVLHEKNCSWWPRVGKNVLLFVNFVLLGKCGFCYKNESLENVCYG